jgi:hypothetical protein
MAWYVGGGYSIQQHSKPIAYKRGLSVVFVAKRIINVVIKAAITTISGSIFQ